jgi:hypothetical protein
MDQHPDFKSILLTRHGADETICVSAYKTVNGNFIVSERFCNGVDAAARVIEKNYEREDIVAIWTNIQRLKPGSDRRKKGETIDAYINLTIDIDRKIKRIHSDSTLCLHTKGEECDSYKCNATDNEVEALRQIAEKVVAFLSPSFGPATFAFSGNGWHLNWRLDSIALADGQAYYRRILALLKTKFEEPNLNVEIDASLADEAQVVTVWGTWNRKYPDTIDRPQRQSKMLFTPPNQQPIKWHDLDLFLTEQGLKNPPSGDELPQFAKKPSGSGAQIADPQWLEDYGVEDLVDFWSPEIAYEETAYDDKDGNTHHPIAPCPCHEGEDFHTHSHRRDCEIIEFADGGIGISCFSKGDSGLSLGQVIKKMNKIRGETYPHRVFDDEEAKRIEEIKNSATDEEIIVAFGLEKADAVPTPFGEVCHKQGGCQCGKVHVQYAKPKELSEEGEFELASGVHDDGTKSSLIVIKASDVKSKPITWLWQDRIPKGKGVILQGMPGKGKSQAGLDLLARISNGIEWPDGVPNTMGPRRVLWMGTEDDDEDTVKPRLQAMGANMENFLIVRRTIDHDGTSAKKRRLTVQRDMSLLLKALQENPDIVAVLFDPISGFYGGVDPNSSKDVRPIMENLAQIARRTGVTIFAIMHENRRKDVTALERTLGSGAVGQVFRLALRFSEDPKNNGGFIMATSKSNTKVKGGLRYRIEETPITYDNSETGMREHIVWGEKHELSADDVINMAAEEHGVGAEQTLVDKAVDIFKRELANGKRLCAEVHGILDAAGCSDKNVKDRARWKLGVKTIGKASPFYWELPGAEKPIDPCGVCGSAEHLTEMHPKAMAALLEAAV